MRKHPSLILLVTCLAVIVAYATWAVYQGSKTGGGWTSLVHAWPYLLAGILTVAAVLGVFVWLALYSDRRGYDERVSRNKR
jgi:cation transporter-like permease